VTYAARLRVQAKGGVVKAAGNKLSIEEADEVVLLFAAATDFRGFAGRQLSDPLGATRSDLDQAAKKSFAELRAAQKADHGKWFNRAALSLNGGAASPNSLLPMEQRLVGLRKERPIRNWRRCILTSTLPAHQLIPARRTAGQLAGHLGRGSPNPWNGDWHLDINVQMNYWPAQVGNLSELQEPLNKLIASLVVPGRHTAKAYYNSRGWWRMSSQSLGLHRARRAGVVGRDDRRLGLVVRASLDAIRLHRRPPVPCVGISDPEGMRPVLSR